MAPGKLFFLDSPHALAKFLIVLATVISVGLPVRIWNNTRIERKLQEQDRALMQARVDALISQINPHFLFNTLNTASSLIRFDPDTARTVLLKLSNILRRRLRSQVHFVSLKQELDFVDDYLDIEVVRFGRDKLQIRKEIDPDTLDMAVPSMILQPLVENAIRHGLSRRSSGGSVIVSAERVENRLEIRVQDDGVGLPPGWQMETSAGLGLSVTRDRIAGLHPNGASHFAVRRRASGGTEVEISLPLCMTGEDTCDPVSN